MTTRQLLKLDEDEPVRQICHTRNNKHVKFYGSRLYMSQSIWKYLNFKFVNLRVLSGAGNGGLERLSCPQMWVYRFQAPTVYQCSQTARVSGPLLSCPLDH